jgi:hypothetical protein
MKSKQICTFDLQKYILKLYNEIKTNRNFRVITVYSSVCDGEAIYNNLNKMFNFHYKLCLNNVYSNENINEKIINFSSLCVNGTHPHYSNDSKTKFSIFYINYELWQKLNNNTKQRIICNFRFSNIVTILNIFNKKYFNLQPEFRYNVDICVILLKHYNEKVKKKINNECGYRNIMLIQ